MAHEKPDHLPLLSPEQKEWWSSLPIAYGDYVVLEEKLKSIENQLRTCRMGASIAGVAIFDLLTIPTTEHTGGIIIIGLLNLVFLLFAAKTLKITYITKFLEKISNKILQSSD